MKGKAKRTTAARAFAPLFALGLGGALSGFGGGCLDMLGDVNVDGVSTGVLPNRAISEDCPDAGAAAGTCLLRCEPDRIRCGDNLLQRCNERGDGWVLLDQCGSAALCDAANVTCGTPACAPREHRCTSSGELEACNADRTGFAPLEQCRSAAFCSAVPGREGCLGTACRAGRQQCNGPQIEQCREDRSGFDKVGEPCASAALCREGEMEFPYCAPPACTPGQFACNGAILSRCSDDAVRYIPIAECASPESCSSTEQRCVSSECAPNTQRCRGAVLERCNPSGLFATVADCQSPELCDAAAPSCLTAPGPGPGPAPDPTILDGDPYDFDEVRAPALLGLALEVSVPEQWTDVLLTPWTSAAGTTLGPRLIASRDAARFSTSFDIPGVYFAATSVAPLDVAARLAELDLTGRCTAGTSITYEDQLYTGRQQNWTNCGATGARTSVVVANDDARSFVTIVIVTKTAARDDEAEEEVWDSFVVDDD